ncbi:MAG: hypothetical protein ACI8XB_000537 [Patiriisocius sp.]|jgi:hypothetical protein
MKFLRFHIFLLLALTSCNTINKDEEIPSFIKIESTDIIPDFLLGSSHHNITDVWVSVDGSFIGVFEVPTTIPVFSQGDSEIQIRAGIQNNGMSTERITYPITKNFVTTVNLVPSEVVMVEPEFAYFDDLELHESSEDFGGLGYLITVDSGELAQEDDISLDSSPLMDIKVAKLTTSPDDGFEISITSQEIQTTQEGPTMLEFNYKADQTFVVGIKYIIGGDLVEPILIGMTTSENEAGTLEWRKIYIDLAAQMNFLHSQGVNSYRYYFATETSTLSPQISLDNIKIIHLPE